MKEYPKLLGNRISIMLNNISARKYPEGARSSVYLCIFSLRGSARYQQPTGSVSVVSHGSALLSCKVPTSVSVFLHLNVDLLKPYKSVLFVKRKTSLRVVSNFRYDCNSADGDSVRVWFACIVSSVSGRMLLLTVDRLWPCKSVLFVKDNNVQFGVMPINYRRIHHECNYYSSNIFCSYNSC